MARVTPAKSGPSPVKILFVCTGNICRSPTAEGVFRALVAREGLADRIHVDSAGTHGYHSGEPPDPRTQEAARRRGIDLSGQRARRTRPSDFTGFDYVLAMDDTNLYSIGRTPEPPDGAAVGLFLKFAPGQDEREVPDPYYGGADGFDRVLDLVEAAAAGLLAHLREHHLK
jgi:protein-tyrosine phosphatase